MKRKSKPGFSGIRDPSAAWARRGGGELDLTGRKVAAVGGTNGRMGARLIHDPSEAV